ncbi:MAG TPA: hypothetical protein VJS13_15200 [Pyrinomonadaceae bacterium]|nr:hypothetical protein [Pyrinomonadaceae bacterium]
MSFTKLKDRLQQNKVPLILAGPMVRRVEPTAVSVWVALREACNIRLKVFKPLSQAIDFESDPTPTFAIGKFLHMAVVTVRPPQPLPDGDVRNYTLSFELQGSGTTQDLFAENVLAATASAAQEFLVYPSDNTGRPSFMVPPASLDQMRIFHTSCRKIDGDGTDAFPAIDHAFDEALRHSQDHLRPTMLFLTGDQIYADGPTEDLLHILTDVGGTLLGQDEVLPVVDERPEDLPRYRTFVAVGEAGLKNPRLFPALGLGEFIALYLLTFSDVLWPPDHDGHKDFRRGLLATRRIFANLATYMIFDDHELSDSWYLTKAWAMPLFKSELGRRVLQNSMSAYALCQAWGNTPDQFAPPQNPPGHVFLNALVKWRTEKYQANSPAQIELARVLGIPDAPTFESKKSDLSDSVFHSPQTVSWHYSIPCKALSINVLDVYTWRKFNHDKEYEPADHLPEQALQAQVTKIGTQPVALYVASNVVIHRHPRTGGDPDSVLPFTKEAAGRAVGIIGVAAVAYFTAGGVFGALVSWYVLAVLLGIALVGTVVSKILFGQFIPPVGALLRGVRQVHYDEIGTEFEWHSAVFERLLDRLAKDSAQTINNQQFARVLILSGDVHHSFAMRLSYFSGFNQATPALTASFAQLVSSPAHYLNESAGSYDNLSSGEFAGWKRTPNNQTVEPPVKPGGKKVDWLGKGEFWVTKIKPELPEFTEKENHRYKIEPIKPNPEPLKFSALAPHAPRTFDDLLSDLETHQRAVLLKARFSEVVRANNISDVTFEVSGDKTKVRQDVWWWFSGLAAEPAGWFIRTFEVDMNPINPPSMPGATS